MDFLFYFSSIIMDRSDLSFRHSLQMNIPSVVKKGLLHSLQMSKAAAPRD